MVRDWEPVKAICNEASAAPWLKQELPDFGEVKNADGDSVAMVLTIADMELITEARTALPDAIAEIEQLRQDKAILECRLAEAEDAVDELRQDKAELVKIIEETANDIHGFVIGELSLHYLERLSKSLANDAKHGGEPK